MLPEKDNLYFVGGVVRDELLKISSLDTDLCFEGDAIKFAKREGLNIIKENKAFGTVRVIIDNKEADIASTRTEFYPRKGHLPSVENIGCSLKEDLKRRDFTVNAMAKRTTNGEIIDYFSGEDDINNKILRVLHKDSFIDDPTRIVRALKFSVRFNFNLSDDTRMLQEQYLNNINYDMSYHRLKKELTETFNLNEPKAYDYFVEQKIYKLLGSEIKLPNIKGIDIKSAALKVHNSKNIWFIYLAPLLSMNNCQALPLTRTEKRILEWINRLKTQPATNNTPKESIICRELLDS